MNLKQIRKELNLTQTQLAEKLGFSRQTISNIENGKRKAGKHFIRAIEGLNENRL